MNRADGVIEPLPERLARLERRMAWVMGSPRTGSSWLLRILIHPARLGQGRSGMRPPRGLGRPCVVPVDEPWVPMYLEPMQAPHAEPWSEGERLEPADHLVSTERAGDANFFFADAWRDVWHAGARRFVLERLAAQEDAARAELGLGEVPVVIKEPNASHAAPTLFEILPRAKLVFLIRDGRDVVDSLVDAATKHAFRGMRTTLRDDQRLDYIRVQSRFWVLRTIQVQRAFDARPEALRHKLRYEDLLADPFAELGPLERFLGTGRSARQIRSAIRANDFNSLRTRLRRVRSPLVRAASPGLWRENLSEAEQRSMTQIMGPKLRELGYEA